MLECGRTNDKATISKFILSNPAPVDFAAELEANFILLSETEKEIEHELCQSSKFCEEISLGLISMVAASKKVKQLFQSVDNRNTQFVDVLIDCNKKNIISQYFVQEYFTDA